jgi:hypothetical protein
MDGNATMSGDKRNGGGGYKRPQSYTYLNPTIAVYRPTDHCLAHGTGQRYSSLKAKYDIQLVYQLSTNENIPFNLIFTFFLDNSMNSICQ